MGEKRMGGWAGKEEKGNGWQQQFVFSATVEEADGLLLQQPIIIIIVFLVIKGPKNLKANNKIFLYS